MIPETKGTQTVLLDNGGSWQFDNISLRPPSPGFGGTISYLAPEREIQGHGSEVGIWSMGIVLFELMNGYHPWKFSSNPWAQGPYTKSYSPNSTKSTERQWIKHAAVQMYRRVSYHYTPRLESYISLIVNFTVRDLLLHMLRHPRADWHQASPQTSIKDTLKHQCWQSLEEIGHATKRLRCS